MTKRTFSQGELAGAVVAALCVGVFLGSMFMELRRPAAPAPGQAAQAAPAASEETAMPPQLAAQVRDLEIAAAQKPGDQGLWIDLGNLYFDGHQPQKAAGAYQKAVALGPVSPDVLTDMGIMLRDSGQPDKAVAAFDAALKLNPAHQNALYNKGVVLLHDLRDRAGALAAWEALLKANPEAKTPEGALLKDRVAMLKKG